jgi:Na+/phosphate symporter
MVVAIVPAMIAAVVTAIIAAVIAAVIATVMPPVAAGFVAAHGLVSHAIGELLLVVLGVRGATGKKGGDEQQGHRAFHLTLLSGSISIRCGASIGSSS